jgi:transposase
LVAEDDQGSEERWTRPQASWWSGGWSTKSGEARVFYAGLPKPARVEIEATGYGQWLERLLTEFARELWFGHATEIRAGVVRKQKTGPRDAAHMLRLLLENRFPRIWIQTLAERDTRKLLRRHYKLVRFRVSVKNRLHDWP